MQASIRYVHFQSAGWLGSSKPTNTPPHINLKDHAKVLIKDTKRESFYIEKYIFYSFKR
jgi:hypothetical protein